MVGDIIILPGGEDESVLEFDREVHEMLSCEM